MCVHHILDAQGLLGLKYLTAGMLANSPLVGIKLKLPILGNSFSSVTWLPHCFLAAPDGLYPNYPRIFGFFFGFPA